MKTHTYILFFLFINNFLFSQSTEEKVDEIINTTSLVEMKIQMYEMTIENYTSQILPEDSIELNELKKSISRESIYSNLKNSFFKEFTADEITDIYHFVKSNAFHKLYAENGLNIILYQDFSKINDKLNDLYAKVENRYKDDIKKNYFEPIPVLRKDGFYATVQFDSPLDIDKIELVSEPAITFDDVESIDLDYDPMGMKVLILQFNEKGTKLFGELTALNQGRPIAIVLKNRIIALPNVNEPINLGSARITLNMNDQEFEDLKQYLLQNQKSIEFEF